MKTYRYPGVKPFSAAEKDVFFGRDSDIENLCDLILLEELIVLFGKSGHGKSSLLQAGVIPELERLYIRRSGKGFFPIYMKWGNFVENQSISPVEVIFQKLTDAIPINKQASFLDQFFKLDSAPLWYHFKIRQNIATNKIVLIFDQFETFFSFPQRIQEEFKIQLSELLYTEIPQNLRDRFDDLQVEERAFLSEKLEIKVLVTIRSDRISLLDQLKDYLPGILAKRYELKELSKEQARLAVVSPAQTELKNRVFASPRFNYHPDAVEKILQLLTQKEKSRQAGIEAFQLQIICQYIEEKIIRGEILPREEHNLLTVLVDDLPDTSNVYEEYYQRQLNRLPEILRLAAQVAIEDGLILEDAEKNEARRLSMDSDLLVQQFSNQKVNKELLQLLEDTFLLRRDTNNLGGYNYEISHDNLIFPILKAKRLRKNIEEKADAERRAIKAEQQILEETARREEAEKLQLEAEHQRSVAEHRRRRAVILALLAVILMLFSFLMGIVAWRQRQIAAKERDKAEDALSQVKEADWKDLNNMRVNADASLTSSTPDYLVALSALEQALRIAVKYPDDPRFKTALPVIYKKIELCKARIK